MGIIVPAVLPKTKLELDEALDLFNRIDGVTRVQIDVVDGKFAKPACWPYTAPTEFDSLLASGAVLPHLDRITYEVDLMAEDGATAAEKWLSYGVTRLTLHVEYLLNLPQQIADLQMRYGHEPGASPHISIGIAIGIRTALERLEPIIDQIDYVQFMGIAEIGKQGQPFDPLVLDKIRAFRAKYKSIPVQVDGGVTVLTAPPLLSVVVTDLIAGSAIMKAKDPVAAYAELDALISPFGV